MDLFKSLRYLRRPIPTKQVQTSVIKKLLKKLGVEGSIENITLPDAIDPVKKVINLIAKIPMLSLKIPTKHIKPIPKLSPPYSPAISE